MSFKLHIIDRCWHLLNEDRFAKVIENLLNIFELFIICQFSDNALSNLNNFSGTGVIHHHFNKTGDWKTTISN